MGAKRLISRESLERHQVWIYVAAIALALGLGTAWDGAVSLESLLWPVLGGLFFVTFTQVPLLHVSAAFRDRRFMAAVLIGNFVFIPLLVVGLVWFLPDDPVLRLGVVIVLLMPCTDWYITFTHLSGGDTGRAIAVTPVNLLVQITLLPVYLWAFMGNSFSEIVAAGPVVTVFLTLIVLPLVAAWGGRGGPRAPHPGHASSRLWVGRRFRCWRWSCFSSPRRRRRPYSVQCHCSWVPRRFSSLF